MTFIDRIAGQELNNIHENAIDTGINCTRQT